MSKNTFYRGDTFKLAAVVGGVVNGAQSNDFTGYELRSQIRDPKGGLIATMTCTWINAGQGIAEISYSGSTQNWPLTTAQMNFSVTKDGHRVSSPPIFFSIEEPATR